MIFVVAGLVFISIILYLFQEQHSMGKLDAILAAIADVKKEVSDQFDTLATETASEVERLAVKLAAASANSTGTDTALQAEVDSVTGSLTDLKATVDSKVGALKGALDNIDGVVGNIDATSSTDTAAADTAAADAGAASTDTGATAGSTADTGAAAETVTDTGAVAGTV